MTKKSKAVSFRLITGECVIGTHLKRIGDSVKIQTPLLYDSGAGGKIAFASLVPFGGLDTTVMIKDRDVMFDIDPIDDRVTDSYEKILADMKKEAQSSVKVPDSKKN